MATIIGQPILAPTSLRRPLVRGAFGGIAVYTRRGVRGNVRPVNMWNPQLVPMGTLVTLATASGVPWVYFRMLRGEQPQ